MSIVDKIRSATDLKTVDIQVPEWDVTVTLREMSGLERAKFENDVKELTSSDDSADMLRSMSMMITRSVIDESGNPVFSDSDIDMLAAKSMSVIQRIFHEALKVNSLTEGDIEELEKK